MELKSISVCVASILVASATEAGCIRKWPVGILSLRRLGPGKGDFPFTQAKQIRIVWEACLLVLVSCRHDTLSALGGLEPCPPVVLKPACRS